MKVKYFICGYSENLGKTIDGKPVIFTESELQKERQATSEATGDNWDLIVLSTIEVENEEN